MKKNMKISFLDNFAFCEYNQLFLQALCFVITSNVKVRVFE